jgi:hypothetical protein
MGKEQRDCVIQFWKVVNRRREEPVDKTKPFEISKHMVWAAYKRVKAKKGATGIGLALNFLIAMSGFFCKKKHKLGNCDIKMINLPNVDLPTGMPRVRFLSIVALKRTLQRPFVGGVL